MENRKVKISLTLLGKSDFGFEKLKDFSNEEIMTMIKSQVVEQFGNRPLFVQDEKSVLFEGRKYPSFYAAGWFVSDKPISNSSSAGSELVVIAHGDDMKSARLAMMRAVPTVDWDGMARDI